MNSIECLSVIMLHKIRYIFKKNKSGFTPHNKPLYFKESTTPGIGKTSLFACDRK